MARYDFHGYEMPSYGYSTTSESYSASSEQIVKYGGYSPYSNHAQVWPRNSDSTHIQPKKGDEYEHPYSPKFSHDSPRKNFHRPNSPSHGHHPGIYGSPHDSPRKNPKGHYSGMYVSPHDSPRRNFRSDDDSSDGEDVECRDGVCYPKPKHLNNENKKGNGYGYGYGYGYPIVHSPDHHQTSDPRKYADHKKPVTDAYYDRFAYPTNNEHKVPAPIKTKPTHHRDARNSPVRGGSPRKEVFDTTEVQWWNGTTPSLPDHKYKRTIDSETLAKLYGGVFVK